MKLLPIVLAFLAAIPADDLSECKCGKDYTPQKDETGAMYCHGVILKSILPCNVVLKPDCVCNNETTSVVQDSSGTWCGKFVDGNELNRWECENKEDWTNFFEEYPEEKPKFLYSN